jgi:hydrogenase 3 maturation protease
MCWHDSLKSIIQNLPQPEPRLAVVGVGHELRGDDAAGVVVVRQLSAVSRQPPDFLVIEGGHAPENCTGVLRQFRPDLVVLVDAAALGLAPGAIQLLSWEEIGGLSASTHTIPLHLLARYLMVELNCQVVLLGIQPLDTTLSEPLSLPVQVAVGQIVQALLLFPGSVI